MIRAVLFDLDGTLADSLQDLATATDVALAKFGFAAHSLTEYRRFVGNGIPKLIERAVPPQSRDAETLEKCRLAFMTYYGEHYADQTVFYDGMPAVLDELKRRGIRLAVITNKAQPMAEKVVEKLYGNRFDLVIGQRENLPTKPHPAGCKTAMETLGVTPEECLFVGDSDVDMQTAQNCGAVPVGVLWGFRSRSELIQNGARALLETPDNLLSFLEEVE